VAAHPPGRRLATARLIAKSDPDPDRIVADIRRRITRLPAGSAVLAEDEKHLDLLPAVRATWTLRGQRHQVMTPGSNQRATVFGALDLTTGTWRHLFARRDPAGFIALLQMLLDAYPTTPAVTVICDNDATHHAKAATRFAADHPRLRLIYSARYSPHDNPVEQIWASWNRVTRHTIEAPVIGAGGELRVVVRQQAKTEARRGRTATVGGG
jgi:hypothetical protein